MDTRAKRSGALREFFVVISANVDTKMRNNKKSKVNIYIFRRFSKNINGKLILLLAQL
jgi:hypothetical protein